MALGMRLKKSPTGKPRVSFAGGRRKETGSGPRSSDRRTGSREGFNRRGSKYESDGDDDYSFRGGSSQSNWKRSERQRGESDVGLSGRRPSYGKRRDFTRDGSDGESSSRGGVRGMRPGYGKRRDFTRDGSEGERSSRGVAREMRPSYGKQRDFTRDGSKEESSSRSGVREMRPGYGKRRDFTRDGSKEESSSRSGVVREMRPGYSKRRDFTRDGSKEENSSRGGIHEMRPSYDKRRDFTRDGSEGESSSRGVVREMRGERRQRRVDNNGSKETGGSNDFVEASDGKLRMKWKKMDKRRQDVDGDDSNAKGVGRRGRKDFNVETSDEKLRSKGKKMDRNLSKDRGKGDAMEKSLERDPKSEDGNDENAEKKIMKRQRVIDKSGKKIRIAQKHLDDGSEAKDAPPKRKKRVIKLDPYDLSNKRLDDTIPNTDSAAEKDIESSQNAQFRAIQPSPSILSFVEDNLLGRRRLNELKNAGYNIKLSAPLDNVPFSTCIERERIEENVFRNKLEFFAAAKISSSFPPPVIPEIAFAGRSNVGKSSLLNALTRQWGVVRTSDKPGLTQTINFFKLDQKLCLVDLPGYGFAYAKEEVKDAWEELVKEYVSTRVGLQKVCLLIDTKWGLKPRDHELIDLMERAQTPYQVVLTKTDVIFPIDVARRTMQIQETLKKNKSIVNPVMMVSSKSGAGVRSLRTVLAKLSRFIKP